MLIKTQLKPSRASRFALSTIITSECRKYCTTVSIRLTRTALKILVALIRAVVPRKYALIVVESHEGLEKSITNVFAIFVKTCTDLLARPV